MKKRVIALILIAVMVFTGTVMSWGGETGMAAAYGEVMQKEPATDKVPKDEVNSVSLNKTSFEAATKTTVQLVADVSPSSAKDKSLIWSSSDEKIATVDQNGLVSVLRYGKAVITAMARDGSNASDSCDVQGRFYDVNGSPVSGESDYQYFYNPVYWAAENGITTGYDYVYFGAEKNCARRELMIFLWRMAGKPENSDYQDPYKVFADMEGYGKNTATYKAIAWGISEGITSGFKENDGTRTFRPDDSITRKDIMIMIYRAAGRPVWSTTRGAMNFTDVKGVYKEGTDTYNAICWAYNNRITNGYTSGEHAGQFGCMLNCLRKDIVTFLYRYKDISGDGDEDEEADLPDFSELEAGDYCEFGSYPQTEVVSQASDSGVYGKDWEQSDDYIINADLYNTLKNLSEDEWDVNGDAVIGDNKYRRIKEDDATYSTSGDSNYYDWSSSDTYHYFQYEPIKWRVLEQNGSDIFLLSEKALDDQMYNTVITNLTWESSTIRSWLNGYGSEENSYGTDYSSSNFIDTAFAVEEQSRIKTTTLENKDNIKHGTEGGNDTNDKVFLLSEDEVYGSNAVVYGFASDYNTHDTMRQSRSSTYAKAMGALADCESDFLGNCDWWLRSPGAYTGLFILIRNNGGVYRGGQHANSKSRGIRPAVRLTLEK